MRSFNFRVAGAALLASALGLAALAQTTGGGNKGRGFDKSRMDETTSACTDFYQYANGNWLKTTEIPPAYSSWGSFNILAEGNRKTLHTILEESAKNRAAKRGTNEQKIGDFYATCMDEAAIEAAGAKPLQPELQRIDKIANQKDLQAYIARMHSLGLPALFGFGSVPDFKNSKVNGAIAAQAGLSLPNRDYYTKTDEKSVKLREEFVAHMTRMFQLLGDAPEQAAANAKSVLALETRLAESSRTPVELRDLSKRYNNMDMAKLGELTPAFSWADYFKGIGASGFTVVNVADPDFFRGVNAMLADVPLASWKTYLRWNLINAAAPALSSAFEKENFDFFGKTLEGRKEQLPRWRRCVSATDANLGEALGQVYVAKAFTPESKARMQTLVNNLVEAFRARINNLDWMSDATRREALTKLAAFQQKIGYPDKWVDYTKLDVSRSSYAENILAARRFEVLRDLAKIGKPVDKTEWGMTPPTVNAYYNPLFNEIAFPAGILQAPFFNPEADDAVNYGAIGAVIGHEITHGFDDSGSRFDAEGNLRNWWTDEDKKKFETRAECIINQFGGYEVEKGLNLQGKLVAGESIADLGGLMVAYDALKKANAGKKAEMIDGMTPEQRFFLGWAQVWASKYTPEIARLVAQSDPHPLSRFRVNGPLSNMPEFAAAFGCKAGDPMVRPKEQLCQVW